MAKAKQVEKDEVIEIDDKEIKKEVVEQKIEDKRMVYIGTNIKTPHLVLNRFTTLLDKPKNFEELTKKSEDLKKLFVSVEDFSKNINRIKTSSYYKQLTMKVQKELGGN
ncbi:MAG: hypothetical protein ACRC4Y_07020 [Cetobacterium sp.]